jgi:crossover junction endodeoxyribonuclease RuvC
MIYIGIDPGKDGALAVLSPFLSDPARQLVLHDIPTLRASKKREYDDAGMATLLSRVCDGETVVHVALEKQSARPGQGVVSMFSTGEGYGLWRGLLAALRLPYEVVLPQRWRKALLSGYPKAETPEQRKALSVLHAQRTFPMHAAQFKGPRGGLRDGRADAALIAEYLCRTISRRGVPVSNDQPTG